MERIITDKDPLDYLEHSRDSKMMHPQTHAQVVEILTMLAEKGEKETLRYIRKVVLKNPVKLYANLPPKDGDPGEKDSTFVLPEQLSALTAQVATPFYLYDKVGIGSRLPSGTGGVFLETPAIAILPGKGNPHRRNSEAAAGPGAGRGVFFGSRAGFVQKMRIYPRGNSVFAQFSPG